MPVAARRRLLDLWEKTVPAHEPPSMAHWSLSYGREVYTLLATAREAGVPEETIADQLGYMEVFDSDQTKQQWEPT